MPAAAGSGTASGASGIRCSPPHPQRGAAGGEDLQRGAGSQQGGASAAASAIRCSQLSRRTSGLTGMQPGDDRFQERLPARVQVQGGGHGRRQQGRVAQRREIDEDARRRQTRRSASLATARASRVLPTPPGPVSVSSGTASSSNGARLGEFFITPHQRGAWGRPGIRLGQPRANRHRALPAPHERGATHTKRGGHAHGRNACGHDEPSLCEFVCMAE